MATREQIIKIHIAKSKLDLSEEEYRSLLNGFGVNSSTELDNNKANDLLETFKKMGWKPKIKEKSQNGIGKEKYNNYEKRDGRATTKQMRTIEQMWRIVARDKSDNALRKFICKITKVNDITFLRKKDATKVLTALKYMIKEGKCTG